MSPTLRDELGLRYWRVRRRVLDRAWRQVGPGRDHTRFGRSLERYPADVTPITDLLYERMSEATAATAEARLQPWQREQLARATPGDRRRLLLTFAAHEGLPDVLAETGLSADMPPEGVHAMARGALAAGGSPYYADLVASCLELAGAPLLANSAILDFGCSSGRVIRVLYAADPSLRCFACDPNPEAIEWASRTLPDIEFARSPEYPPLPYADGQFDAVFAISIWSHFAEEAALRWAEEIHRIVKPGGHWLVTTQGLQTIAHAAAFYERLVGQLVEIARALYEGGFWFAPEFGEKGDYGVRNPDWGFAFLSAEWLLARLTPQWHVAYMHPGRAEGSQDVYVLQRV